MADAEPPNAIPLIVSAEAGVVAVAKPAGLPTQAPPGIASVESWFRDRVALPGGGYVGVPHRLDRAVSGIILLAATPRAARHLSRQFERRQITKRYLALLACCSVRVPAPGDVWEDHVLKVTDEPRARLAASGEAGAKRALTVVGAVEAIAGDRLLVVLEPATGRMHQLRVQAAARSLPVVGDELYGGPPLERAVGADHRSLPNLHRSQPILLHAWDIVWRDPDTGRPCTARAALPESWPEGIAASVDRLMIPAAIPRG
ncbi:MAG: RluA family pseudouridine synthase [Planctomycetia bacterium]|nr:RluA family pseudouridine synthase [Planctomycetia bacterium]